MAAFEKGHIVSIRSHPWSTGLNDSWDTDDSFPLFGLKIWRRKHRRTLDQGPDFPKITTTTGSDLKEQTRNTEKCFVYKDVCHRIFL